MRIVYIPISMLYLSRNKRSAFLCTARMAAIYIQVSKFAFDVCVRRTYAALQHWVTKADWDETCKVYGISSGISAAVGVQVVSRGTPSLGFKPLELSKKRRSLPCHKASNVFRFGVQFALNRKAPLNPCWAARCLPIVGGGCLSQSARQWSKHAGSSLAYRLTRALVDNWRLCHANREGSKSSTAGDCQQPRTACRCEPFRWTVASKKKMRAASCAECRQLLPHCQCVHSQLAQMLSLPFSGEQGSLPFAVTGLPSKPQTTRIIMAWTVWYTQVYPKCCCNLTRSSVHMTIFIWHDGQVKTVMTAMGVWMHTKQA